MNYSNFKLLKEYNNPFGYERELEFLDFSKPEPTARWTANFTGIKKVIFNGRATIVIWEDNTKTIVRCMEGVEPDKWTGLAMCIAKRLYGHNFKKEFRKWCDND